MEEMPQKGLRDARPSLAATGRPTNDWALLGKAPTRGFKPQWTGSERYLRAASVWHDPQKRLSMPKSPGWDEVRRTTNACPTAIRGIPTYQRMAMKAAGGLLTPGSAPSHWMDTSRIHPHGTAGRAPGPVCSMRRTAPRRGSRPCCFYPARP